MIGDNDCVVLYNQKKVRKYLVNTKISTMVKFNGLKLNPKDLIGKEYFDVYGEYILLKPSTIDKVFGIKRQAQIILPKDAATIILNCGLKSGVSVIEGGIGSGALTIVLAEIVYPARVISYEIRSDFAEFAKKNLELANINNVEIKHQDITKKIDESAVDSVIVDIPNPEDCVGNAYNALKNGGYFCSYVPTMNQVEKVIKKLRNYSFIEIKTYENLQREIVVSDGTRPSFKMLAHTGYLTFARKLAK